MAGSYERCGARQVKNGYKTCNRKAGHKGDHTDSKHTPATYWKQEEPNE